VNHFAQLDLEMLADVLSEYEFVSHSGTFNMLSEYCALFLSKPSRLLSLVQTVN
jgi:hypothetical protein